MKKDFEQFKKDMIEENGDMIKLKAIMDMQKIGSCIIRSVGLKEEVKMFLNPVTILKFNDGKISIQLDKEYKEFLDKEGLFEENMKSIEDLIDKAVEIVEEFFKERCENDKTDNNSKKD